MKGIHQIKAIVFKLSLLITIALILIPIWSISELYTRRYWWSGNDGVQSTIYTIFGPFIGSIIFFFVLYPKFKSKKTLVLVESIIILFAIVPTILCLPYFIVPQMVGQNAKAEFNKEWGLDWESRIGNNHVGPWLKDPYSIRIQSQGLPYNKTSFTYIQDVVYRTIEEDNFKVDICVPNGAGPFPVIICIHGGGWCGGDKEGLLYQREYLASAGYVVFSVQYGAHGNFQPGAWVEKGISRQYSMQEIMDNLGIFSYWLAKPEITSLYKVDISKCFVNGYSAGGHLSALLITGRFNVTDWNPDVKLLGGINFYGIPDLRGWNVLTPEFFYYRGLMNDSVLSDYTVVDRFSPITYLQGDSNVENVVPILNLHGLEDSVVPIEQSRAFDAIYQTRGLKSVLIEIPKAEHVFEGRNNDFGAQLSLWAMERFLQLCLV